MRGIPRVESTTCGGGGGVPCNSVQLLLKGKHTLFLSPGFVDILPREEINTKHSDVGAGLPKHEQRALYIDQ